MNIINAVRQSVQRPREARTARTDRREQFEVLRKTVLVPVLADVAHGIDLGLGMEGTSVSQGAGRIILETPAGLDDVWSLEFGRDRDRVRCRMVTRLGEMEKDVVMGAADRAWVEKMVDDWVLAVFPEGMVREEHLVKVHRRGESNRRVRATDL